MFAPVVAYLLFNGGLTLIWWFGSWIFFAVRWLARRQPSRPQDARSIFDEFRSLSRESDALLVLGVLLLLALSMREATVERLQDARNGLSVSPVKVLGVQVLPLRATRVRVSWEEPEGRTPLPDRGELQFLGAANGVSVFYQELAPRPGSLRLPSDSVLIAPRS